MPVSGSNGYRSGIVTLPNRVRIREMDSRLGLYPKIKRTGDKDRNGNDNVVPFDDGDIVIFNEGVSNLLFGSLVTTGSTQSLLPYASNNNPNGGISGTGNVIAGISDSFYMTDYKELSSRKNNSENITPYDESRIYLEAKEFYMTGTLNSEYSGYSSRLYDKTQIVIDISSNESTDVGYINKANNTNYENDSTDVKQPLMAYYNSDLKRWERTGVGIGMNQTSKNTAGLKDMLELGHLGFSGTGIHSQVGDGSGETTSDFKILSDDILNSRIRPVSTFGFPFSGKYHATGSQTIRMKDYINKPFLVEKVVFEINAELESNAGPTPLGTDIRLKRSYLKSGDPSTVSVLDAEVRSHNFFILRQFKSHFEKSWDVHLGENLNPAHSDYSTQTITASVPGHYQLGVSPETTYVEDEREMITYGQFLDIFIGDDPHLGSGAGITKQDIENSKLISGRDSVFSRSNSTVGNISSLTSSFRIEAPVRHTGKIQPGGGMEVYATSNKRILFLQNDYTSRGRDRLEKSARALFNGHQSNFPTTASYSVVGKDANDQNFEVTPSRSSHMNDNSPYILFPEDEIIIGYQYHAPFRFKEIAPASNHNSKNKITFAGPGKVILFGSQIKENKEFHDTLNQPLTSEAVHESLHFDNPVVDQFEVSTRYELSGSYLDAYRDPDISIATDSDLEIESLATSGNSLAGSLQRFVKMHDKTSIFYDTAVPDPLALWALQTGSPVYVTKGGIKSPSFGVSGSSANSELGLAGVQANSNSNWFRSFVYDNSLSRVSFESQTKILRDTFLYFVDGVSSSTAFGAGADQYVANFTGFNFNAPSDNVSLPIKRGVDQIAKRTGNALMWLYGFGTGVSGSLAGSNPAGNALYAVTERPRGYKYGVLSVVPIGRTAVYRASKFGQYADMMEQGLDSIYLLPDKTLTQSPVDIRFVARENDSTFKVLNDNTVLANTIQSSNISKTATSSLPYFDDLIARNRGVAKSTTPTAVRTITIVGET